MPERFTVTIPCRPHIAKYAALRYGSYITINNSHTLGALIIGLLQKPSFNCRYNKINQSIRYQQFTASIQLHFDKQYLYHYGLVLTPDHIIQINTFLENDFSDRLAIFTWSRIQHNTRYKGYSKALMDFADQYNIIIDQDITFDGLKKIEYRTRKNLKLSLAILSRPVTTRFFVHKTLQGPLLPSFCRVPS